MTEPALYRHYAGKEALYADLLGLAGDHIVEVAASRMADVRPETLHAALTALVARGGPQPQRAGTGGMMGILLASAPHNQALLDTFRDHLARPMVASIRAFVPRVDAFFGITRSPEQLESAVRAFTSLLVGYFATAKVLGMPDDDAAIVDAMLAVMGWAGRTAA